MFVHNFFEQCARPFMCNSDDACLRCWLCFLCCNPSLPCCPHSHHTITCTGLIDLDLMVPLKISLLLVLQVVLHMPDATVFPTLIVVNVLMLMMLWAKTKAYTMVYKRSTSLTFTVSRFLFSVTAVLDSCDEPTSFVSIVRPL
jgi:hypothetical protein